MSEVIIALRRALADLSAPPVLALMVVPVAAALLTTILLGWLSWDPAQAWLARALAAAGLPDTVSGYSTAPMRGVLSWLLLVVMLVPIFYLTAILILSTVTVPALIRVVGARSYAALELKRGGSDLGSAANAVYAGLVYVTLWVITLPLWLVPPAAMVSSVVLSAWLNERVFRYDTLARHASRAEYSALSRDGAGARWALATMLALLSLVPVANLLAPAFCALAFVHFSLMRLSALRGLPAGGAR